MTAAPDTPCFVALASDDIAVAVRIMGNPDSFGSKRFIQENRLLRVVVRPLAEAQRLLLNFAKLNHGGIAS